MVKYPVVGQLTYNPENDNYDFIPVEKQHKTLTIRKTIQFKYTNKGTVLVVYAITTWSLE